MAFWLTNWGRKGWTRGSDGTATPNKNIYKLQDSYSSAQGDHRSNHILSIGCYEGAQEHSNVDAPPNIIKGCRWDCGTEHCALNHLHQGGHYFGCDVCNSYIGQDLNKATHMAPEIMKILDGPNPDLMDIDRDYIIPRVYVATEGPSEAVMGVERDFD